LGLRDDPHSLLYFEFQNLTFDNSISYPTGIIMEDMRGAYPTGIINFFLFANKACLCQNTG